MKFLVIIPAFNAAERLPKLLSAVIRQIPSVLVVDDGSSDQTSAIAARAGVAVIRHEHNMGKGAALKSGFAYALKADYDVVVTLDSDGQHDPGFIPTFLKVYEGDVDFIIGSRIRDRADMPWNRRFSNWTTSHILSWLLGRRIEDAQCGYRLYSRRLLESLRLESDRFELETEIIIKAVQAGFAIKFVSIRMEYGPAFPSHISPIADTLRWCRRVLELI